MNFNIERARSQKITPIEYLANNHADKLNKQSDALFINEKRNQIIGFTGLDYSCPICQHISSFEEINTLLSSTDQDLVFVKGDELTLYVGNKECPMGEALATKIEETLKRVADSVGTLNENGELQINLKGYTVGSHYGVNLLLGDRSEYPDALQSTPKAVLDHFGRGSFRGKQEKQVLATRYELSPEVNGETANRQFYITENGKQIFYSLDTSNCKEAYAVHSQNRTVITYFTDDDLKITRTIFILPQIKGMPSATEVQRIHIENLRDEKRNLRVVVTGMFGITDPGTLAGDIVYANVVVESEIYYQDDKAVAVTAHHQPKACDAEKRYAMLLVNGETMDEYASNLYDFIGDGSYEHPEMVSRLSNNHSRRQAAFFAMAKSFELDKEIDVDSYVGMSDSEPDVRAQFDEELDNLYKTFRNKDKLSEVYDNMISSFDKYTSYITVDNNDAASDSYINKNLPFQVLYQTYVSRSFAWTQKSYRETGFREIQDIFASMYYMHANKQDELIEKLITSWAENVFEMGYSYHNFTTRGKEPGMCSDDQLWLLQAVYRYVKLTGNTSYLTREIKVAGTDKTRPLIDTLKAIVIYSGKISVGKHMLPLLDRADWNDALRLDVNSLFGPEKEELYYKQLKENNQEFGVPFENEQSESVMNACLLKIAADHLSELASDLGNNELSALANEIAEATKVSVNENAFKDDYYARCLINDGRGFEYLGAKGDNLTLDPNVNGTYYLNSFSWPLLADIADEEKMEKMLNVVDKYLRTPAGLKLVTPVNYDLLGIVTGSSFYFDGDRENGGVFKHAAMMATVACLQQAKKVKNPVLAERLKETAFFMIDKTLPYKTLENPFVLKGNPRFCTQYNNSITCEGIGPILSGTASWLTLAVYEILGIEYHGDKIKFNPIINSDSYNYTIKLNSTNIHVSVKAVNDYKVNEKTTFTYDGNVSDSLIVIPNDQKDHELVINL